LVPHRWRVVVDRPRVALQIKARPRRSWSYILTQEKISAISRILERLRVAHGFCHTIEDRLGVLAITEARHQRQGDEHKDPFHPHQLPPFNGAHTCAHEP